MIQRPGPERQSARAAVTAALMIWCAAMLAWAVAARRCNQSGGHFQAWAWTCTPAPPAPILERGIKRI